MRGDSPWLIEHRRQERALRHARFRNSVEAAVLRAFVGAMVGGGVVLFLKWAGLLP